MRQSDPQQVSWNTSGCAALACLPPDGLIPLPREFRQYDTTLLVLSAKIERLLEITIPRPV
jgi:hypothetical protein